MSPLLERSLLILVRLAAAILAGLGLYLFFRYFWPLVALLIDTGIKVLLPLLIAYLIALLLHPVIGSLEQRLRINRTWGTAIVLFVFLAAIGGLLFLLAGTLIRELLQLYQQLSVASQGLGAWNVDVITGRLRDFLTRLHLPPEIVQNALQNYQQVFSLLRNIVNFLLLQMYYLVMSLPRYLYLLIVTVIASFFFARDLQLLKKALFRAIPERWQTRARRVASGLHKALQGYLKAELFLVLLAGVESLIGMSILGVGYALILSILAVLLDFLPVLGTGILYVPWAIWLLFAGNLRLGIGLLLLYGIIVLVRQLVEPRILAHNIGLHPLTMLISIYLGIMLLGFWGLVVGPAAVIAYKAFLSEE